MTQALKARRHTGGRKKVGLVVPGLSGGDDDWVTRRYNDMLGILSDEVGLDVEELEDPSDARKPHSQRIGIWQANALALDGLVVACFYNRDEDYYPPFNPVDIGQVDVARRGGVPIFSNLGPSKWKIPDMSVTGVTGEEVVQALQASPVIICQKVSDIRL